MSVRKAPEQFASGIKIGQEPNGMKLGSGLVLGQLLRQCPAGCDHEREARGVPFLDARLHPMRTDGVDDQGLSRPSSAQGTEPPQGLHNAQPLQAEAWKCGGAAHAHADQVLDEREHGPCVEPAWHRVTGQHIHRQGGLEVRSRAFDLPALAVQGREVGDTAGLGSAQRRPEGPLAGPEARPTDAVAPLAACEGLWSRGAGLPREP